MNQQHWEPHEKQAEFLSIPYEIKEAAYLGGAGTAKTETIIYYPLIHKFHENERFKQVILRRTTTQLSKEVLPRAKRIYRPYGGQWNSREGAFTFPSGAKVYLAHCEHEDDVHQFDSMEINLFTPDEVTSLTEYMYLYIAFERVRTAKGSGLPAIIRPAGMPGDIGHGWVKNRFITGKKPGVAYIGRGGVKRMYIRATCADNPHIDPDYKNSLMALPEAEKQAKLFGNWDAYLGSVFEEFRDKHYSDEPPNAVHVIEPFEIPTFWPKIVFMDWGFAPPAMTYVGYGAISPDGRLYVYREQWWQKVKIEEWAPEVKYFIDLENPRVIRLCKSAGQDRGQTQTIEQQISVAIGRNVELTSNAAGSRVATKMLVHEYLRYNPKKQFEQKVVPYNQDMADAILRMKGMEAYDSYISQYLPPKPEMNLPKLQIFNTCPKLIGAIKQCEYDKNNPQDVAEFPGDDPYDAIRYGVDCANQFVEESSEEFKKVIEQQRMVDEFNQHHDWNRVYHKSRIFEAQDKPFAVRRYH